MKTFKLMFNYKDEGEPEILGVSTYGELVIVNVAAKDAHDFLMLLKYKNLGWLKPPVKVYEHLPLDAGHIDRAIERIKQDFILPLECFPLFSEKRHGLQTLWAGENVTINGDFMQMLGFDDARQDYIEFIFKD